MIDELRSIWFIDGMAEENDTGSLVDICLSRQHRSPGTIIQALGSVPV